MSVDDVRSNAMMAHLLDALNSSEDIGHYGRLVFAMVMRHFVDEQELVSLLRKDPQFSEEDARALVQQVQGRDYNPPRRERVLEWQKQQEFPICPNPDDPDACNVYKDLKFPDEIYESIQEYQKKKSEERAA